MAGVPLFEQMTVIGLGLIGSSIARAAYERGVAASIVGCDVSDISLSFGRKHGFIDRGTHDTAIAVQGSDLVILAVPLSELGSIAASISKSLSPGALVMDCCSVKEKAIAAIAPHIPTGVDFVPAHPIAGSEQSGISAGRADLFERRRVIVSPSEPLESAALQKATAFWQAFGARVEGIPAKLHDWIYGYVSHLPQLLAFAAGVTLQDIPVAERDDMLAHFLRLSNSNRRLWLDIFLANEDVLASALDRYLDALRHIASEMSQAPQEQNENDKEIARRSLLPRIAASCLVTTVMEAEKKQGFSLARYAGAGFADFTYPVAQEPDADIERISANPEAVQEALLEYIETLVHIRTALESGRDELAQALAA